MALVCASPAMAQKSKKAVKKTATTTTAPVKTVELPNDAELLAKAQAGDAEAQYNIARAYDKGTLGVQVNLDEAFKWYCLSAEQGYVYAQYALAICYQYGEDTEENYTKANELFKKTFATFEERAKQGEAKAQNYLGRHYNFGFATDKNLEEAAKWYQKSAENGQADAQFDLAYCYHFGALGLAVSKKEAIKWYKKAGEQDHAEAQYNVGLFYENGYGVTKNINNALEWYKKAARNGNGLAKSALRNLGSTW